MMNYLRLALLYTLVLTAPSLRGQSGGGGPVIENLTADPATGDEGTSFRLTADASHHQGSMLTYTWNFGDGTPTRSGTSLAAVHHRYQDQGEFSVGLTVSDSRNRSVQRVLTITVKNVAPEIRKVVRVGGSSEGSPITFSSLVLDPGKDELTYSWDFGDGQTQKGRNKRNAEHTYQNPGTYQLNLTVDDGDGGTDRYTQAIIIGEGLEYSISGAFGGGDQPDDTPFLTGVPVTPDGEFRPRLDYAKLLKGENAAKGSGFCAIGFGSRSGFPPQNGSAVRLSGALPTGIEVGSYPVGAIREGRQTIVEWPQSHISRPGLFFGTAEISTGTPDSPSTPDFESIGGSVEVTYYDGDRIEATFSMTLLEVLHITDPKDKRYYPPRTISVSGSFAHTVNRNFLKGEFPDWYLCDPAENLEVESYTWHSPERPGNQSFDSDTLIDYESPEIEIRLSDEYDLDSFFTGFKVEYLRADGEYEEVPGFIMGVDSQTVKYIPLEDLMDGVTYRARIDSGSDGIKGLRGETLENDVEWTFETLLNLEESLSGIGLGTYQVIQDAPLVPGKPTLTRVFINWREKPEVHPSSQTRRALVEVSVRDGAGRSPYSERKTVRVKRPDLYSKEEKKHALSSVNFFGWEPDGSESPPLIAEVKQLPQPDTQPKVFEGQTNFTLYEATPKLVVDYFFARVGSWKEGVPTDLRTLGHRIARGGAEFTTQNFPVTETTARNRGDIFFDEALISIPGEVSIYGPTSFEVGIDWEIGRRIAEAASATGSTADLILAFLPKELQPTLGGYSYGKSAPRRTVAVFLHPAGESKSGSASTVAHEFGHTFGLTHRSGCPDGEIDACILQGFSDPIEGFRMDLSGRSGWNKSRVEGNQQAARTPGSVISMMYPSVLDEDGALVLPEQYTQLQEALKLLSSASARTASPASSLLYASTSSPWGSHSEVLAFLAEAVAIQATVSGQEGATGIKAFDQNQWLAHGMVKRDGTEGLITHLGPAAEITEAAKTDGPFELVAFDSEGQQLFSQPFSLPEVERFHPAPGAEQAASFSVKIPSSPAVEKVVLKFQGRVLDELRRSPAGPAVHFLSPEPGVQVAEPIDLEWEGTDLDGTPLIYSLYYSPDGSDWMPVILATGQDRFRLEPSQLVPGTSPRLKLMASDRFQWAAAELPITLDSNPVILYTSPVEGGTLVTGDSISVSFSQPIRSASVSPETVRLLDSAGNPVEAERFMADDHTSVLIRPKTQLSPGDEYRLQIRQIEGSSKGHLDRESIIAFTAQVPGSALEESTRAEVAASGVASGKGEEGGGGIPDSCGGVATETLRLLAPPKEIDSVRIERMGQGCGIRLTSNDTVDQMRNFYESEILFNGFRMTENVIDSGGENIRLGFSNARLSGQINIVKGPGNSSEIEIQLTPQ